MKSIDTVLLGLLLAVAAAGVVKDFLPSAPPAPQVQATQRWEYKQLLVDAVYASDADRESAEFAASVGIETDDGKKHFALDEAQLASLGEEGWELVAALPATETAYTNFGNSQYVTGLQPNVRSGSVTLVFKRPLVGAAPASALLPQSETAP
ncbi:hypothetical protein [Deinococcus radiophilus]|uniref:DUF4177 domain-containing protein n=1 Tax=Deinococcus radiophilus TaxID=32062 RepID=A0A3S0K6H1_9DEIO|nr:hypothetical protein [Deinococcus radiophilus]RTR22361.1 hypothetical protein EJ104_12785 [Deinococcus radiophilus]